MNSKPRGLFVGVYVKENKETTPEEKMIQLIEERKNLKSIKEMLESIDVSEESKAPALAEICRKLLNNYLAMNEVMINLAQY